MKATSLLITLAVLATTATAQDWSFPLRCNVDTPGPYALDELTWQQGSTPLIELEVYRRGRPQSVDTNLQAIMIIGPSATNEYFVATTNYAAAGNAYLVQWPVIGTNTANEAWWYTVYFEKDGQRYWTGNGDLYIEATTSTQPDGLVWQTVIATLEDAPSDGAIYGRKDAAWVDVQIEAGTVSTDATLIGAGTVGDPLAVAAAIVSGAASGAMALQSGDNVSELVNDAGYLADASAFLPVDGTAVAAGVVTGAQSNVIATAYQPADPFGYSWITNPPTLFDGSYLSLDDVPSEFTSESHEHSYEAITNAPWITEYIQAIVAAGGDATLGVTTNGTEVTYEITVTFLDWIEDTDPAYLAAFTNLVEGAGISITGTGRSRTIESTITQYEDTDAVAATAGVYLPIDGTADAAEKLISTNGLTWLIMASQTGTLYWVTYTGDPDTNTIVKVSDSGGYNGPDGPWEFVEFWGESVVIYRDNTATSLLEYIPTFTQWYLTDESSNSEWQSTADYTDPFYMPVILNPYSGSATGNITVDYRGLPVTNSIALATAESVAAAIAALNLGSMVQEDAGDYYDKTEVDALIPDITAASVTPKPVTNDWLYLSAGSYQSLDSSGATTNSLSIEPGLATGIDFIRLDVKWDGVSTILWPGTNLVYYADTLAISSNQVNSVVFDSKMFETNWTAYQIGGE